MGADDSSKNTYEQAKEKAIAAFRREEQVAADRARALLKEHAAQEQSSKREADVQTA